MKAIRKLFALLRAFLADEEPFPVYPLTYDEWEQLQEPVLGHLPHAEELGLELTDTGWAVAARSPTVD